MLNVVALMGRLTHTPELKTTQNGTNVCSFSIAVDRTYTPKGEERKADFIDIVAWRQTAEHICKYFQKGSMIAIDGSIQTARKWKFWQTTSAFAAQRRQTSPLCAILTSRRKVTHPKQKPLTAPRRRRRASRRVLQMILQRSQTMTIFRFDKGA